MIKHVTRLSAQRRLWAVVCSYPDIFRSQYIQKYTDEPDLRKRTRKCVVALHFRVLTGENVN